MLKACGIKRISITDQIFFALEEPIGVKIIPYVLDKSIIVRNMTPDELKNFRELLLKISSDITDDEQFFLGWDVNCARRWDEDYKNIFLTFRDRIENPALHRNDKNLF